MDPNIAIGNLSTTLTNLVELETEEQGFRNILPYASIPILFISLFLGYLIRSYHKTLSPLEKTTLVLFDIGITHYLQAAIQIFNQLKGHCQSYPHFG
jgi:hypothetical protein